MGLFSRFTKKKELVGASQDKEGNSAATSPRRRPSFEGKFLLLSNKTSQASSKNSDARDKLVSQISNTSSLQKEEGLPVGVEDSLGGSRSSGRIISLMDSEPKKVEGAGDSEAVLTPKSPPGFEHPEAESSFDTDRGGHFAGVDRPPFSEPAFHFHMEGEERHGESESDSSGEEGGSEREEEEREENESELGGVDEDRFGNEGGRFEEDADFYGTKKEEVPMSEGGYRSEGGQTAEQRLNEEGREYHSEGLQGVGLELSEREADVQNGEQVSDGRNEAGQEVTSPEEGPPSSKSVRDSGEVSGEVWDQRREGGELPKSDNEALTLAAAWEKEKNKKKPWWKVFGPSSHHQRKHSGDSCENLTPRSGTESEPRRDLSPMSDTAALQRKDSAFRGRQLADVEKQSEGSPRSRSPLWFFRREGVHKRGGDSGSPTSPPGAGALGLSSPRASNGSLMVREASPMPMTRPEEPSNPVMPAVAAKSEEGYTALLRREHLRAVPERREMSWVKEWVSKVDPAEAPSDIEPEVEVTEEPSSPPSWQGNLLLGPSPREPEAPVKATGGAPVKATGGAHVSADLVFANAVASEVDIRTASAYLGARGLKMVPPSLSIFGALKTLDLSRNAIAHIPSGVLPRGLHYLDLSFNKLTAVEGLRELTRLRVLNLHANRIVRIGHGLATCQSLRELHLSGNKIGEVEGLHRLLKLQVLDLSDNKISSTKSLGQLAANYSSLQALNLIGNPVLASLGADQLRRFIVGLVPQVMYLNKQTLKTLSGRDVAVERMVLGSKGHSSARGSKREKAHGKSSPRRGRASASSVAGPSSKRSSMGRSKSSSRLAPPPAVSRHHHHHHRTSSQSRHRSSGGHTGHHNAHSIPRERASSEVQPGLSKVSSPMKPPRHPSISGTPVDAPPAGQIGQIVSGFEFNVPRVYSEGALETPHRLVKQYSGEF